MTPTARTPSKPTDGSCPQPPAGGPGAVRDRGNRPKLYPFQGGTAMNRPVKITGLVAGTLVTLFVGVGVGSASSHPTMAAPVPPPASSAPAAPAEQPTT